MFLSSVVWDRRFAVDRPPRGFQGRFLSPIVALLLLGLSPSLSGCTAEDAPSSDGGQPPISGDSVSFDDAGTLELSPSELRAVSVTTTPGATVSFLILGNESYDASLDQSSVVADQNGSASVTLKAPSKPSAFHLLATTGKTASAELPISVSSLGFASVQIVPDYQGSRDVSGWSASVAVGSSCDQVLAQFPQDPSGALKATANANGKPLVMSVPVGPSLAIAVRSGALMWGCVDTQLSTPSLQVSQPISVINRPMALSRASLTLGLEFSPSAQTYPTLLEDGANLLSTTAFPQGPVAGDLLDAMRSLVPPADQDAFDTHRQTYDLDTVVGQTLKTDPRALISSWLTSVKNHTPATPPPQIQGVLSGTNDSAGLASFDVTALGPVSATVAGVSTTSSLTWSASADDTMVIGGQFSYSPTRYVGALLSAEAVLDTPTATDASSALALGIDCASIGPLVEGYANCDSGCGEALCEQALASMWQRGIAGGDGLGLVDVAVSGSAEVDAMAEPSSLAGNWLGDLSAFGSSCVVKGQVTGEATNPPN